jgi:hypothetical protein
MVETLKLTLPNIYEEQKGLIEEKILGSQHKNQKIIQFMNAQTWNASGKITHLSPAEMPSGIKQIIELLSQAFEYLQGGLTVNSQQCLYTATISFRSLKASLTILCNRFNYVIMFPHRILVDRKVLEISLRKHGMFQVLDFLQSAEEHFNNQKYVEFCAISRNALQQSISSTCMILEGEEHGFSNNINKLEEIGFLKGTISKQMKEFGGSLSACGSHPPQEKLTNEEAKFLIDLLYSFVGLMSLRLSTFKKSAEC